MREIYLHGKYGSIINNFAIIDDEDYELIQNYHWWVKASKKKYVIYYAVGRKINNSSGPIYSMHRIILGLKDKTILTDHIDHNGLNNIKQNLRICNISENNSNRRTYTKKDSQYKGVRLTRYGKQKQYKGNKWSAHIHLKGQNKQKHLGIFDTEEEAAKAYDKAAQIEFGEFACLNFA